MKNVVHLYGFTKLTEMSTVAASFNISVGFTAAFDLDFVLTQETLFLRVFTLSSKERAYALLKDGSRVFEIALLLRDRHFFI